MSAAAPSTAPDTPARLLLNPPKSRSASDPAAAASPAGAHALGGPLLAGRGSCAMADDPAAAPAPPPLPGGPDPTPLCLLPP